MLNIIVCDDDAFTLNSLSELLNEAIKKSNVNAKTVCLASAGQELLQFIRNAGGTYLYFIDYDLGKKELNGIDLVRLIYRYDPNGSIVFVTSHTDKGLDILRSGVRAIGFIEKTLNKEKMIQEYIRYIHMAAPSQISPDSVPSIELPIGIDEFIKIPISNITYVDSVKTIAHSICYHTYDNSEITVRDTLENAQKMLGADFIKCHRSVLVNKNYVISLKNSMIKLSNGIFVSCALSKRKLIMDICFERKETHYD